MKNILLKSTLLTLVQYASLLTLFILLPWEAKNTILLIIQVAGIILGFWAIIVMSRSKLNITPMPREGSVLVSSGPYHLIRHPMYLALMLYFYPLVVPQSNPLVWSIFIIFNINLILKLLFEENLLNEKFPGYKDYSHHSWKLIPWVF